LPQSTNTVCMLYHLRAKFSPNLLSYLHTINTQQMHMITITAFTKFIQIFSFYFNQYLSISFYISLLTCTMLLPWYAHYGW